MREPIVTPKIQSLCSPQMRGGEGLKPTRPKRAEYTHYSAGSNQVKSIHPQTPIPFHRLTKLINRVGELETIIGDKPKGWRKPNYGHLDYTIAHKMGWIRDAEETQDRLAYTRRREQSLTACHRYSHKMIMMPDITIQKPSDNFTPEMSATILNDHHLTDGAKLLALKLMEQTYRENREGRWLKITVSYLARALGRCTRTIQNYLRLLEHYGYIRVDVIKGKITRMCTGLAIWLEAPLFPKHHSTQWPQKRTNSGVQADSYNNKNSLYTQMIPLNQWAKQCMEGIYRSFQRNDEPYTLPDIQL